MTAQSAPPSRRAAPDHALVSRGRCPATAARSIPAPPALARTGPAVIRTTGTVNHINSTVIHIIATVNHNNSTVNHNNSTVRHNNGTVIHIYCYRRSHWSAPAFSWCCSTFCAACTTRHACVAQPGRSPRCSASGARRALRAGRPPTLWCARRPQVRLATPLVAWRRLHVASGVVAPLRSCKLRRTSCRALHGCAL
jgi:hypothetical protein